MSIGMPVLVAAVCAIAVLQGSPADPRVDGLERVRTLEARLTKLRSELGREFEDLKRLPEAEREAAGEKLVSAFEEASREITEQLVELARKEPEGEVALAAIGVALGTALAGEARKTVFEILDEHHALGERIVVIVPKLQWVGGKDADALLRKVLDRNPSRVARGLACFQIAMRTRDERAREKLLERCTTEFGDVDSAGAKIGELAGGELRALRLLRIGSPAFEIEGKDMDGVPFKLSDYRGKVVVLDFWGYW